MAKAAVVILSTKTESVGTARASFSVSVDTGLSFSGDCQVVFSRSVTQIGNDIKDKVISHVSSLNGPVLSRADIVLFGGPT